MYRPMNLPNGLVEWHDSTVWDVARLLREGYPPLGWEGDDRLALVRNALDDCWEVWRACEDGDSRLIVRSRPGSREPDHSLIQFLVDHDARRGYNLAADAMARQERNQRAAEGVFRDRVREDLADRLHHALRRDGAHRYA